MLRKWLRFGFGKRSAEHEWSGGREAVLVVLCVCFLLRPVSLHGQQAFVEKLDRMPAGTLVSVRAVGRTQRLDGGMYRYQWPGVYFLANYAGQALYFRLQGGTQRLQIRVDGLALNPTLTAAPGVYRIRNATAGNHSLRIDAVNENISAPISLGAFTVGVGGHDIPVEIAKRQMEFIGDSHTVGYGNISGSRECSVQQRWAGTDVTQSPGAEIAAHYGAEYQMNAISGRGVVRNLLRNGVDTVPVAYPFVLLDGQTRYQDAAWHPSVLVVSLGVNDFSNALQPGEPWKTRDDLKKDYERGYVAFLETLRARNPKALIVLWATELANGEVAVETERVARQLRKAGDRRVEFVKVTGLNYQGCDWHPSAADDRVIARLLIQAIDRRRNGWP